MIDQHQTASRSTPGPVVQTPPDVAPARHLPPAPLTRNPLYEVMRWSVDDDLWFGYEFDTNIAHLWFTPDQLNAVSMPVDDRLALLVDDATDDVIGFTIDGFRQEYLARLPAREQWMHRLRIRPVLDRDIPIRRLGGPRSSHQSALLADAAFAIALDRLLVAIEAGFTF